jgi:hypothetical protein
MLPSNNIDCCRMQYVLCCQTMTPPTCVGLPHVFFQNGEAPAFTSIDAYGSLLHSITYQNINNYDIIVDS